MVSSWKKKKEETEIHDPRNNNQNESEGTEQGRIDGHGRMEKKNKTSCTQRLEKVVTLYINKNH